MGHVGHCNASFLSLFVNCLQNFSLLLQERSLQPVSTPGKATQPPLSASQQPGESGVSASPQQSSNPRGHVATTSHHRTRDTSYRGEIRLGLMFSLEGTETRKGTLHVAVKDAKSLDKIGQTDSFVKLYLLPEKTPKGKRKTAVIKNSLNPVWEEQFTYEKVSVEDLSTVRVLEVTVWDFDRGSSNEFVGGLRIGPAPHRVKQRNEWMDSNQEEAGHWTAALTSPGKWVERWHSLRASMDPRDIDLSDLSSFLAAESEEEIKEEALSSRHQEVSTQPSLKGRVVGEGRGNGGIPLSAIAKTAKNIEEEDQEFRKVSVGDQTSTPHEVSIASLQVNYTRHNIYAMIGMSDVISLAVTQRKRSYVQTKSTLSQKGCANLGCLFISIHFVCIWCNLRLMHAS